MLRNIARCIGTMIGFVALFLIVVYGLFVLLQAMFSDVDKIVLQLASSFVADVIISVCAFIYLRKRPLESVIFDRSKLLLLVPLLFVLWIFVQVTTKNFSALFPGERATTVDIDASVSWLYVILTLIAAPIGEEFLFRGIVYGECRKCMSLPWAYVISSFMFGLLHGNITQLFLGLFAGFLFAIVYEYTHYIIYPIIFHCLFNTFSLLCGGLSLPDFIGYPVVFILVDLIILTVLIFMAHYIWFKRNDAVLSHVEAMQERNEDVCVRRVGDKHDL